MKSLIEFYETIKIKISKSYLALLFIILNLHKIFIIYKLIFRSVKECLNGKVGDIGCPRDEEIERTKPCFFDECPHYSEWYSWTLCSKSCGGGIHQRHRICKHGDIGDLGCPPGQDKEHQNCEEDPCPHWGSWTRWSPCDKKCGRGYQIARRGCEFGYKNLSGCRGPDLKRKLCFKHCKELGSKDDLLRYLGRHRPMKHIQILFD